MGAYLPIRNFRNGLLILCAMAFLSPFEASAIDFLKYFTFSEKGVLKLWKEKLHKGKVDYRILKDQSENYIRAIAKQAASGMYYEIKYDPSKKPYLSWKWRVDKFPKKDSENRGQFIDDFAARIYVIFPANVFIFSRCLEYVWDDILPQGTRTKSPLSNRIKLFVIRNGKKKGWVQEERNIYKDYLEAYGEDPQDFDDRVGAIAFMTDTDDSESSAIAYFDEMRIGYSKPLFKGKTP